MALKRTTIFLDSAANRTLRTISKRTGLAPAQLTRLAIAQFIKRETVQKSKAVSA
jgi:predicted transcriptional regulator